MFNWFRSELVVFPTLRGYHRNWLGRDLLAGITFGAITIPGQLATARLAGMPPITGLYGFLAACLVATLLSTNRHLALGCDSTVAPILAAGLAGIAVIGSPEYTGLVIVATATVGVVILAIGVAKLAWVGDFLSKPVVTGFLAGIAVTICVDQLPALLGVKGGSGYALERIGQLAGELGNINGTTVIISCTSLALLLLAPRLGPTFPGALLILIGATVVVTVFNLADRGVAILGALPTGLPPVKLPPIHLGSLDAVLPTTVAIVVICLAQTSATTRTAAAVGGFDTDLSADFRALGLANIVSSLFGSFTIDASPPSTAVISSARARSQLAGLTAAGLVLLIILFAGGLMANLPEATLSAVLVYISTKIFDVEQMKSMWNYSWRAFWLMAGTLAGVVVFGIEVGLGLAVLVAFADRARRTARPELLRLGRTSTGLWLPEMDDRSHSPHGVEAYLLNGPLWFGNANWFKQEMIDVIKEGPHKPYLLVLDTTRIDDIDYTGCSVLFDLAQICELRDVKLAVARHLGHTGEVLDRSGLARELADHKHSRIFDTVEDAVVAFAPKAVPDARDH
ncbi:MAG: SulP family inorganic anion transporter [Actinomycetes bacterium]